MKDDELGSADEFGVLVHVISEKKNEQVRLSINEYRGHQYIDIRAFYEKEGRFLPTKKGVTVPIDDYPELLQGVLLLGRALSYDVEADIDHLP